MHRKGNVVVVIILVLALALTLFLIVPVGGQIGLLREATISFIFRKPPKFISLDVMVNNLPRNIKAGQQLQIKGDETIVITKIHANTFFESYLTADIAGFGKTNDLNEPIHTQEIRKQLLTTGLRSIPIEIFYIEYNIAKIPLEIELTQDDFEARVTEAREIDEKIAVLKSAHASFPVNEYFLDKLDELLSEKSDFETLVSIYKPVVESQPDNIKALARLSRYYIKINLFEESLAADKKIVEKGHATSVTFRRMAYVAGQLGRAEERVSYLKQALDLDKGNEDIILDLGKTYEQMGNTSNGLNLYRKYAASATRKEILIPVVENALKKKDYKEAAIVLQRYVTIYKSDSNAYAQLGMVMGILGDAKGRIKAYEQAVALSPNDPVLLYNLATAYDKAGWDKSALSTYTKVLKIKPKDKDSLARAANLSLKQGKYSEAYHYYSSLVKLDSKTDYIKGLVSAAVKLEDNDKIIEACSLYLKNNKDYDVALSMAYAYEARAATKKGRQQLDDLNAALDAYRLALDFNSKSTKAQQKIPELRIRIMKLKKLY